MALTLSPSQTILDRIQSLLATFFAAASPIEEDENEAYFETDPGRFDEDDEVDYEDDEVDDPHPDDDEDDLG